MPEEGVVGCLELSLLGPFQVLLDGKILDAFAYNKVRALLAYLAAESGRPQRRPVLADLLWPGWSQAAALRNLSSALANLRKGIGDRHANPPFLLISRDYLQLNPESDLQVDLWEFLEPAKPSESQIQKLETKIHLYRGAFLEGFSLPDSAPFEEWLATQREMVQRHMLGLLKELVKAYEKLGEYEPALSYARRGLKLEPWLEEAHQGVMRLLARNGQRGAALVQYEACRKALQEGLGVEPGAETLRLFGAIRNGRIGGTAEVETQETQAADAFLPTDSGTPQPRIHNLPAPSTSLVGRQLELERLCNFLNNPDCRLVTVLGEGGSGKSRLALEAGRSLTFLFPDGVFWVEPDTFQTDRSLAPLVCAALDLKLGPSAGRDMQNELIAYLRHKKLLLIMDGFEGILHEAGLVADLLSHVPQLKILVTSRLRLNIQFEYVFPLSGLDYPAALEESDSAAPHRSSELA